LFCYRYCQMSATKQNVHAGYFWQNLDWLKRDISFPQGVSTKISNGGLGSNFDFCIVVDNHWFYSIKWKPKSSLDQYFNTLPSQSQTF
jgi:hypothetical protein